ncbi:MAG: rhomboid family intramembrane serine protease [Polyangiaceae bacterium]|nr:rhomboid family intramembrane serine protease [Polyangiaceae bacterium]
MQEQISFGLPKPGRALIGTMIGVTAIWVLFAAAINWGSAGIDLFNLMVGSDDVYRGQVWRLLTSFMVHQPSGPGSVGHLLTTLFGLYFLGASLEQRWGGQRFLLYLFGAGLFASSLQLLVGTLIPTLHQEPYYGALGVIDAIAVAWALSFRGQQVRLFFVLPISGFGMIVFIVVMNVLYIIAMETRREGLVTPFGGMLAGFLFAEGSPVRRRYLQWKLGKLQAQSEMLRGGTARPRARPAHLSVIQGGQSKKPDKSMLN